MRDIVRDDAIEHLGMDDAVLVVDETGSLKQGKASCGVSRQYTGDGDLAFFTTWCPAGTSVETLVGVEGNRWAIEDSFETAK